MSYTVLNTVLLPLVSLYVPPDDDHEAHEPGDDVPDEVHHQLVLGVVLLQQGEVVEAGGQQQVAERDGDGGGVLLQVAQRHTLHLLPALGLEAAVLVAHLLHVVVEVEDEAHEEGDQGEDDDPDDGPLQVQPDLLQSRPRALLPLPLVRVQGCPHLIVKRHL